jgi:hypothetical protein
MDLDSFIKENRITMSATEAADNPGWTGDPNDRHFKVVLHYKRRQMTTYFSMGPAHTEWPRTAQVLRCLADDSARIENTPDFDDWEDEMGYFRGAWAAWKQSRMNARKLKNLLGDELYDKLLWGDTE